MSEGRQLLGMALGPTGEARHRLFRLPTRPNGGVWFFLVPFFSLQEFIPDRNIHPKHPEALTDLSTYPRSVGSNRDVAPGTDPLIPRRTSPELDALLLRPLGSARSLLKPEPLKSRE